MVLGVQRFTTTMLSITFFRYISGFRGSEPFIPTVHRRTIGGVFGVVWVQQTDAKPGVATLLRPAGIPFTNEALFAQASPEPRLCPGGFVGLITPLAVAAPQRPG